MKITNIRNRQLATFLFCIKPANNENNKVATIKTDSDNQKQAKLIRKNYQNNNFMDRSNNILACNIKAINRIK